MLKTVLLLPEKILNTKEFLHIPKDSIWELYESEYRLQDKPTDSLPINFIWNSGSFSVLDKIKEMGLVLFDVSSKDIKSITSPEPIIKESLESLVEGDEIWIIGMNGNLIQAKYHSIVHKQNIMYGNIFKDSKSALKASKKICELLGGTLFDTNP